MSYRDENNQVIESDDLCDYLSMIWMKNKTMLVKRGSCFHDGPSASPQGYFNWLVAQ